MYDEVFLERLGGALRSALPRWDLGEDAALSLLNVSENATFLAEAPGRRLVVRLHRPGYHRREEIESELQWIAALRAEGVVETPQPLPTAEGGLLCRLEDGGEERFAVAFDFMSGREPAQDEDLEAWFRHLGALSARLHGHARAWRRPAGFQRKLWDFDAMLGERRLWGDWRRGLGLAEAGPEALALLERAAALLQRRLAAYGRGPERFGLVHADLRLANLLVEGERLGVIDFDDCGFSWFVYDFAAAVSFFEHEPIVPALQQAWVEGYRSVAPLAPEEEAEIPVFVMLRRMLLTAWVASHAETPTAQEMGTAYTEGTLALAEDFLGRYG